VFTQLFTWKAVVALKPCSQAGVHLIDLVGQCGITVHLLRCVFIVTLAHLRCTQLFVSATVAGTLPGPLAQNLAAQSSGNNMLPEAWPRLTHDEPLGLWANNSAKQNTSGAGNVKDAGMCRAWCAKELVC
jgi:hypothetical protein